MQAPTFDGTPPSEVVAMKPKRRTLKIVLAVIGVIVLIAGGIVYWALNRYVVDHVRISDVSTYEAQVATTLPISTTTTIGSSQTVPSSTAPATTPKVSATTVAVPDDALRYSDGASTKTIEKVTTGTANNAITYFVADVVLADATALRSGFAENKFGDNIIADTSTIAAANKAVFAINGDYYGYRRSGIVIRNGVAYRDNGARQGLAFFRDGTMKLYDEKSTTAAELLASGAWNTLSFGPGMVEGGQVVPGIENVEIDTNIGNHSIQGNQPRTGIGMVSANHLLFIVVDGRSRGYSRGVSMREFATLFKERGATVAYNLDGGGSSTMVMSGDVVNDPLGKGNERGTSDILYIGAAAG